MIKHVHGPLKICTLRTVSLTSVVIMVSNQNFQTILQSKYFETFGKKIKICRVKWSKLKI